MCLQVRSASSGPRQRDSSRTLENSSLGDRGTKGENNTAYARQSPPRRHRGAGLTPRSCWAPARTGRPRVRGAVAAGAKASTRPARPAALLVSPGGRHGAAVRACVVRGHASAWRCYSEHRRFIKTFFFFFLNQTNLSARLQKFVKSKP